MSDNYNNESQYIIVLNDEDGNEVEMEYIDLIGYEGKEYVVLLPTEEDADEVVFF